MKSARNMLPPPSNHRNYTMEIQHSTYRWRKARPPAPQRGLTSQVKAHFRHNYNTIGHRQQLEQLSFADTKPSQRHVHLFDNPSSKSLFIFSSPQKHKGFCRTAILSSSEVAHGPADGSPPDL
jgi:hypothetical protein